MVSFVDLLPAERRSETVVVLGRAVSCRALTLGEIIEAVWRFPKLSGLFTAGAETPPAEMIMAAPGAAAWLIAVGTGVAGDQAEEEAIAGLPPGSQIVLLASIIRLSAPEGITPLINALTAVLNGTGAGATANEMPS